MSTPSVDKSTYRIGAVSRLTGVPPDTLRVWERRYGVVEPHRTDGGSRLYSQHDVARLTLIKRLVDAGQAIGTVANLELEQLEGRVSNTHATNTGIPATTKGPTSVVIVGDTLAERLKPEFEVENDEMLRLGGAFQSNVDFEGMEETIETDVLVVELPTVNDESLAKLRRMQRLSDARRLIVVYGFGTRQHLLQMEDQGLITLRYPVGWEELRRACRPDIAPIEHQTPENDFEEAMSAAAPARLFDDYQLAQAANASTTVKCECPQHLAELVISLSRFEQYSAECENRSRNDAALHAYLHVTTARARLMLEEALEKLVEIEGIALEHSSGER